MLAISLHGMQLDKAGRPYVEHPMRVATSVALSGGTPVQEMAAWLHDVLEDTDATVETLCSYDVPWQVIDIVEALTHLPNEPNVTYWNRIAETPYAVLVKLCDIYDNLNPARMCYLDEATQKRLRTKYGMALVSLSK